MSKNTGPFLRTDEGWRRLQLEKWAKESQNNAELFRNCPATAEVRWLMRLSTITKYNSNRKLWGPDFRRAHLAAMKEGMNS